MKKTPSKTAVASEDREPRTTRSRSARWAQDELKALKELFDCGLFTEEAYDRRVKEVYRILNEE